MDGFRTIIGFSLLPGVFFRQKEVTPFGYSCGSIETTTMMNGAAPFASPAGATIVPVDAVAGSPTYPPTTGGVATVAVPALAGFRVPRTYAPKTVVTITEMSGTAQYDPAVLLQMMGVLGILQSFTVYFPDGAVYGLYGWLDEFKPQQHKEGDFPLAEFKIMPSGTGLGSSGTSSIGTAIPGMLTAGIFPGSVLR